MQNEFILEQVEKSLNIINCTRQIIITQLAYMILYVQLQSCYKFDFPHQIDASSSNMHLNQTHVTILFLLDNRFLFVYHYGS